MPDEPSARRERTVSSLERCPRDAERCLELFDRRVERFAVLDDRVQRT